MYVYQGFLWRPKNIARILPVCPQSPGQSPGNKNRGCILDKQSTQNMWEIYYIIDHTSMYIHCRWGWIYSCSLWMEFHSITRIAGAILGFRCSMFTKKELVFHRNTPGKKNMCIVQMTWIQKLSIKYVFINVSCIWSQLLWTVYLVLLSSHLQNMLCWANRFGAALP